MRKFKDIEDIEAWLDPMDYDGFWYALAPYGLAGDTRAHCDDQIKQGASADSVLNVMKAMVRIELTESLNMKHRRLTPWVKLVEAH